MIPKIINASMYLFLLFIIIYFLYIIKGILDKKRKRVINTNKKYFFYPLIILMPIVLAFLVLSKVTSNQIWTSFQTISINKTFLITILVLFYFLVVVNNLFPLKESLKNNLIFLGILNFVPGFANAALIYQISNFIVKEKNHEIKTLFIIFISTLYIYIASNKVLRTQLNGISCKLIKTLRDKIFEIVTNLDFYSFESARHEEILSTINGDVEQVGALSTNLINLIPNIVSVIGIFIYLFFIHTYAASLFLATILLLTAIVYFSTSKASGYLNTARETRNIFYKLIDGLLSGFKELKLHSNKLSNYKNELFETNSIYSNNLVKARNTFVNTNLLAQSFLFLGIMLITFVFYGSFDDFDKNQLVTFTVALLYLIGPMNFISNSIPSIMQLKIAVKKIVFFIKKYSSINISQIEKNIVYKPNVNSMVAKNIWFEYQNEHDKFSIGPISFSCRGGEVIIITGGNGSGKTTLLKILCGLYKPSGGNIEIDGKEIDYDSLGEYFSVIFSDHYLFDEFYDDDLIRNVGVIGNEYIERFRLAHKVKLDSNKFSTIDLSSGQRKRLALIQSFLEDRPIYIFDEWAANQDAHFKDFFYKEILNDLKEKNKIILVITHDERYFHVADKIIKLENGKMQHNMNENVTINSYTE